MSDESSSIDFILSARDEASSVFRKTASEVELLRDRVEQTSQSSKKGTDVVGQFARFFGAGWIDDAAQDMKMLSDGVSKATQVLKSGGSGALAMKAGLVGLVAYGSFKVGSMIGNWFFETERWNKELEKSVEINKRLSDEVSKSLSNRLSQQMSDLKEFGGTFEQQREQANQQVLQLSKEAEGIRSQIEKLKQDRANAEGWINDDEDTMARSDDEIANAEKRLEIVREGIKARQQEYSEAEENRLKAREQRDWEKQQQAERQATRTQEAAAIQKEYDAIADKQQALRDEVLQLQTTAEEYELIKLRQVTSNQLELEKLETLVKQKHELERHKKDQEELAKIEEQANKKRLDAEIKGADQSVKLLEKEIDELSKIKIDVSNPSLTSKDERMTSLSRGTGDIQHQQLEQAKRQVKIAELQQKLMAEIARYQKLIAEKEDPILSLGA